MSEAKPEEPEREPPVFKATIEGNLVKLAAADAFRLAFPMEALNELELGYAALLAAKFTAEATKAGHTALAVLFGRLAAAVGHECDRRQLPLESVVQAAAADLAAKTLLAAKPASGGPVN